MIESLKEEEEGEILRLSTDIFVASMKVQVSQSNTFEQIFERIMSSRKITREDQLMLLTWQNLSMPEQVMLNQVFDRLRMGLLKVVD